MSLLNQVLRDLDARHAPNVDRAALPGELHALPPERLRPWRLLVLAVAAAGGAAWYLLAAQTPPPEPPLPPVLVQAPALPSPPVAAPAPEPAATVAEAPQPAAGLAEALPLASPPMPVAQTAPVAPAAAPVIAAAPAAVKAAAPKPAANIAAASARPQTKGKDDAAPAPAVPTPAAVVPVSATRVPAAAETAAMAASIDKRPRTAPGNEAADAEYRKAMSALRRGAVSEAVDGLRRALRADRQHISARQALLSLLVEQQQWSEAQALIEEGLALDPAQTGWAMALARLQFEHGKLAEATETLLRHAAHAEQNADYQAFLALLLQKQKRPAEAAQRYRAALALKPAESRWWYGLGLVLESEQKPQEARAAFLKARETGNLSPEVAGALEQRLR